MLGEMRLLALLLVFVFARATNHCNLETNKTTQQTKDSRSSDVIAGREDFFQRNTYSLPSAVGPEPSKTGERQSKPSGAATEQKSDDNKASCFVYICYALRLRDWLHDAAASTRTPLHYHYHWWPCSWEKCAILRQVCITLACIMHMSKSGILYLWVVYMGLHYVRWLLSDCAAAELCVFDGLFISYHTGGCVWIR